MDANQITDVGVEFSSNPQVGKVEVPTEAVVIPTGVMPNPVATEPKVETKGIVPHVPTPAKATFQQNAAKYAKIAGNGLVVVGQKSVVVAKAAGVHVKRISIAAWQRTKPLLKQSGTFFSRLKLSCVHSRQIMKHYRELWHLHDAEIQAAYDKVKTNELTRDQAVANEFAIRNKVRDLFLAVTEATGNVTKEPRFPNYADAMAEASEGKSDPHDTVDEQVGLAN